MQNLTVRVGLADLVTVRLGVLTLGGRPLTLGGRPLTIRNS